MASVTRQEFEAMVAEVFSDYKESERYKTPLLYLYPELDLSGLDLSGMELHCLNFDGVNFTDTNLSQCNLYGTSFYGAILHRAVLRDVQVRAGNLSKDWRGADFTGADLTGMRLSEVSFNGYYSSSREKVPLENTNKHLRRLYRGSELVVKFDQAILVDTDLRWMHLEGVSFVGANLTRTKLSYSFFNGANMQRAILKGANIEDVDFTGANLSHANMNGASIDNFTKFIDVDLTGAILINVNSEQSDNNPEMWASKMGPVIMINANCTGADMRGISFSHVISKVNFTNADLARTNFSEISLSNCDFTGSNLCGADVSSFIERGKDLILIGAKFDSATKQPDGWFWTRKNKMIRVD
ncbi:MAG: pentapeptide repeat-containing protein [Candidatus Pacebacteria bacterium]|nr:pentapeptide repeat-containing protein [Candidatus Paceibacterota bacterium]